MHNMLQFVDILSIMPQRCGLKVKYDQVTVHNIILFLDDPEASLLL